MNNLLKNNILKNTIGGNLFCLATTLLLVFFVVSAIYFINEEKYHTGIGMAEVILWFFAVQKYLIVIAVIAIIFVLELIFKHRLKADFFVNNIFFNIFFYFNFICTLVTLLFLIVLLL